MGILSVFIANQTTNYKIIELASFCFLCPMINFDDWRWSSRSNGYDKRTACICDSTKCANTAQKSFYTRLKHQHLIAMCVHGRACAWARVRSFVCICVCECAQQFPQSSDWKEIIGIYFFRLRFPFHLHHSLFKFAIVCTYERTHTSTSITLNTRVIFEFSENSYFVVFGRMRRRHPIQTR